MICKTFRGHGGKTYCTLASMNLHKHNGSKVEGCMAQRCGWGSCLLNHRSNPQPSLPRPQNRRMLSPTRDKKKVFGMAISTILQCFIADEEMFKGDDRYGEGDLAAMLDKASRTNSKGQARVVAVESKPQEEDGEGAVGAGENALP